MMTAVELARLVEQMRAAQLEYFRARLPGRRSELLGRALAMEHQVDKAVAEILAPRDEATPTDPEGD